MSYLTSVPVGPGIQSLPGRQIPKDWNGSWYTQHMNTWLANGDARNGIGTNGITISGNGINPVTIGFSGSIAEPSFGAAGATKTIATYDSGTFTGTLTGVTGTVTASIPWARNGSHVDLSIPAITGTSNAITMTITGLPAGLIPPTKSWYSPLIVTVDNGTPQYTSFCVVTAVTGVIQYWLNASGPGTWTNSGTKSTGLAGQTLSFSII